MADSPKRRKIERCQGEGKSEGGSFDHAKFRADVALFVLTTHPSKVVDQKQEVLKRMAWFAPNFKPPTKRQEGIKGALGYIRRWVLGCRTGSSRYLGPRRGRIGKPFLVSYRPVEQTEQLRANRRLWISFCIAGLGSSWSDLSRCLSDEKLFPNVLLRNLWLYVCQPILQHVLPSPDYYPTSTPALVDYICHVFFKGSDPLQERKRQDAGLKEVDPGRVFCTFCGVGLLRDVMKQILDYVGYDRGMIYSLSRVNWDFYVMMYSCWNGSVGINSGNIMWIPRIILQNAPKIVLRTGGFRSMFHIEMLVKGLNVKKLSEMVLGGACGSVIKTFTSSGVVFPRLSRISFYSKEATDEGDDDGIASHVAKQAALTLAKESLKARRAFLPNRRIVYHQCLPRYGRFSVNVRTAEEEDKGLRLCTFAPNLVVVRTPPFVQWCEGLARLRELRVRLPSVDHEILQVRSVGLSLVSLCDLTYLPPRPPAPHFRSKEYSGRQKVFRMWPLQPGELLDEFWETIVVRLRVLRLKRSDGLPSHLRALGRGDKLPHLRWLSLLDARCPSSFAGAWPFASHDERRFVEGDRLLDLEVHCAESEEGDTMFVFERELIETLKPVENIHLIMSEDAQDAFDDADEWGRVDDFVDFLVGVAVKTIGIKILIGNLRLSNNMDGSATLHVSSRSRNLRGFTSVRKWEFRRLVRILKKNPEISRVELVRPIEGHKSTKSLSSLEGSFAFNLLGRNQHYDEPEITLDYMQAKLDRIGFEVTEEIQPRYDVAFPPAMARVQPPVLASATPRQILRWKKQRVKVVVGTRM